MIFDTVAVGDWITQSEGKKKRFDIWTLAFGFDNVVSPSQT